MRMRNTVLAVACLLASSAGACLAADWHVSPAGKVDGKGTREAPWDLASALGGGQKAIRPGDTIYLLDGNYRLDRAKNEATVSIRLAGAEGKPITIRPAARISGAGAAAAPPGHAGPVADAHVVIDGGLQVEEPSACLVIRDLEIMVGEPRPAEPLDADPTYANIKKFRPWGGLNILAGRGCRYVNLVIHDCLQGVGFWQPAVDSELYGCIIYDNGWAGKDRGHGHAVYTQNKDGNKTISNCIFTGGHGWTMHAYGSKNAYVDNYVITDNITYAARNDFLVGGGRASRGIRVTDNFFHGASVRIGYTAKDNEDVEFARNVLCGGRVSFNEYRKVNFAGNTLLAAALDKSTVKDFAEANNVVVGAAGLMAAKPVIFLRPNRYDPACAHLAIYYPGAKRTTEPATVEVDVSAFLKDGRKYRLMDPRDLWGKPVATGEVKGKTIQSPLNGELGVYVLIAE